MEVDDDGEKSTKSSKHDGTDPNPAGAKPKTNETEVLSDDDLTEDDEEKSSQNLNFLVSKLKEPTNERPVDADTKHGQDVLLKRHANKELRKARDIVFEKFSTPTEQLASWPKCPTMTKRDIERQQYIKQLTSVMTDAKKLNAAMQDAKIRQIGKK